MDRLSLAKRTISPDEGGRSGGESISNNPKLDAKCVVTSIRYYLDRLSSAP